MDLVEIHKRSVEEEALKKLATVKESYKDDSDRVELFSATIDMLKEAETKGQAGPFNPSELISVGVQLVEDAMQEKEEEEWTKIGEEVAELLRENFDITAEDVEKIASDDEADEFGRFCARLWATAKTGTDYLGLDAA